MNGTELVWRREIVSGTWIKSAPIGKGLAAILLAIPVHGHQPDLLWIGQQTDLHSSFLVITDTHFHVRYSYCLPNYCWWSYCTTVAAHWLFLLLLSVLLCPIYQQVLHFKRLCIFCTVPPGIPTVHPVTVMNALLHCCNSFLSPSSCYLPVVGRRIHHFSADFVLGFH